MNRILSGAALAVALMVGQAASADEPGVNLLVTPKVGRIVRTRAIINITLMGKAIVVNGTARDVVKEVKANGDVVIETIDEGSTISANGSKQAQPPTPPYTSTHDRLGKTVETQKDPGNGFTTPEVDKLIGLITDIILTDKIVKPNDTWETAVENPAVKEQKVTVKDIYLGRDKIDGKDYWKIKQTAEAVTDPLGSKVTYEVTEWIDPTDGATLKFEGTIKNVPTQVGPMSMRMSSRAIKLDEKATSEPAGPTKKAY